LAASQRAARDAPGALYSHGAEIDCYRPAEAQDRSPGGADHPVVSAAEIRDRVRPRLWYALGYGNGITSSAIAARLLVDAYRGRPSTDTSIFALDRPSLTDTLRAT
jgi:glycine/D-amino acid oxidase-like deaminating enzyme